MVNFGTKKWEEILIFLNIIVFVILINIISSGNFFRIDLTEEKRFSISEPTKELLKDLDDVVYVEVYLEGDLPSGFERMKRAVRETLEEFRVYSGNNVQFKFIDPTQARSARAREEFFRSIANKGVQPTDVFLTENGKRIQKRILPGAVVSYGVGEKGVLLLKGNFAAPSEVRLNQSIEGIEFELASTIRDLTTEERKIITFIQGHGELDSLHLESFKTSLREKYTVNEKKLSDVKNLSGTDMVIIAKPQKPFSDSDKYKLDQFIMNGGRALFMIDALSVDMDSAGVGTFAFPLDLQLTDLLFKYGVRINNDYVQDIISGVTPVVIGNLGDRPQVQMLPWPFYPIINNLSDHIITKNLNAVYARFISSIDTVKADGVHKTPLIFSSSYSRTLSAPVSVNLNELKEELKPDMMNKRNIPLGYLLEGTFSSLFETRFPPKDADRSNFREKSIPTRIIVFPDGDLARNEVNTSNGRPLPLGFEPYSGQNFGNLDLMMNTIAYLLNDNGVIQARAKEILVRPLDKVKINQSRLKWQIINLGIPVILIIIYGIVRFYMRKSKYSKL